MIDADPPPVPAVAGRVAAISFQRLGDLLLQQQVLDQLLRLPEVESVDLIHWKETSAAAALLPGLSACHGLSYRSVAGKRMPHELCRLAALRRWTVEQLWTREFDAAIVLTPNQFSARFAPSIFRPGRSNRIYGPHLEFAAPARPPQPPLSYIRELASRPELNIFAWSDLQHALVGLQPVATQPLWPKLCSFKHERIAHGHAGFRRRTLAVHLKSSTLEKDWPLDEHPSGWANLLRHLHHTTTSCVEHIVYLGAPSEREELAAFGRRVGVPHELVCDSLAETLDVLRQVDGLLSVDTVTIHLASLISTPCISLRRGPALGYSFLSRPGTIVVDDVGGLQRPDSLQCEALANLCSFAFGWRPDLQLAPTELRCRRIGVGPYGLKTLQALPFARDATQAADSMALDEAWRSFIWRSWRQQVKPEEFEHLLALSARAHSPIYSASPDFGLAIANVFPGLLSTQSQQHGVTMRRTA